jgi:iron complex outermembrane receptor protein
MPCCSRQAFFLPVASLTVAMCTVLPTHAQTAAAQTANTPRLTQEVVVTATLAPVPFEQLARAVGIVTREDMERWGVRSVVDGLRFVPGVDPRARGPFEVQTDFSIRGSTFGQNLVLADGMRLNDTQSGHHNGELPLPSIALERIEVLTGAGSASHGADALGGTINILSRRDRHAAVGFAGGQHGLVDVQSSVSIDPLPEGWLLTGWGRRSDGFMYDREFALGGGALRAPIAPGWTADVRHQRRAFGANGFYGPSPSKEWTDQTLAAAAWTGERRSWTTSAQGLYRNHGDHFLWDINRPGFAENRHRTHATELSFSATRATATGTTISIGGLGGGDWVTSSNLGDHHYGRGSAFAEWQQRLGTNAGLQAALRFDGYSNFGQSWSPSVAAVAALSSRVRTRVSAARAFRVPTFTELYYSDPANLGSPDLRPEKGWSLDGGVDVDVTSQWMGAFSLFRRWDQDVIDWVRASPTDRYRSTNIRDVTSTGFEFSLARRWAQAALRLYYAGLTVDAPELTLQSKYLLEYARHQSGGSLTVPVVAGVRVAVSVDHRHRVDGQSYQLVTARVSRAWRRLDVFVDGTNLLDETYHEIAGVAMPGRWITAGFTLK